MNVYAHSPDDTSKSGTDSEDTDDEEMLHGQGVKGDSNVGSKERQDPAPASDDEHSSSSNANSDPGESGIDQLLGLRGFFLFELPFIRKLILYLFQRKASAIRMLYIFNMVDGTF